MQIKLISLALNIDPNNVVETTGVIRMPIKWQRMIAQSRQCAREGSGRIEDCRLNGSICVEV